MISIKKFIVSSVLIWLTVFPIFSLAQNVVNPGPAPAPTPTTIYIPNPTKCQPECNDLMSLLIALLDNVIMPIAAVAVVMWIIWAGFTFLTAQGNPAKLEQARQRLLWSLIGAGILLGAEGISKVVQNTVQSVIK